MKNDDWCSNTFEEQRFTEVQFPNARMMLTVGLFPVEVKSKLHSFHI